MEQINLKKVRRGILQLEKYLSKDEIIKLDLEDRLYVIRTLLPELFAKKQKGEF